MRRLFAVVGSALFLLIAPGTVAGLVPWWISHWRMQAPLLGFSAFRLVGALLIAAGIPVLLDSFARFALRGLGTPPPFPRRVTWWSVDFIAMCAIPCTLPSWG